jgi:chemosensory pili system protein ChpA (sensor histidine kinase/response regulator)
LPLTTAVTQVVMLRMGELSIGVPSNLMETVLRSPDAALQAAYHSGSYNYAGEQVPFYWGGALLHVSGRSVEAQTKHYPVAIFRSAGQRLALHVDEVLGNREVVVKNLGPQLARLPGLAGMSVLASGAVVLIYNPVALATVYGMQARSLQVNPNASSAGESIGAAATVAASTAEVPAGAQQLPLVLVVDDSITVRRVTQRLLKREGFRVVTANDGLDALEKLAHEKPDVVLSDIEMPRMDGFDLARNIRADANLADLPIIMITSRIAEKHREHAMALGVNNYLGKPYSEEVLLGLLREYCAVTEEA